MVKGYIKAMEEAGLTPDIIKTTGVLEANEQHFIEYLDSNPLEENEHSRYEIPRIYEIKETLYETEIYLSCKRK